MPISDSAIFKFNFVNDDDDEEEEEEFNACSSEPINFNPTIQKSTSESSSAASLEPFQIIPITTSDMNIDKFNKHIYCHKSNIKYINVTSSISNHISQQLNTDLVQYKYEGGFKLWECSEDLLEFLLSNSEFVNNFVKGKNVLELGCGHALPGIYCLVRGEANCCAFQDYNRDVIEQLTIPNVIVNTSSEQLLQKCEFYSGDWGNLSEFFNSKNGNSNNGKEKKFDFILMSDTIYHVESYERLYRAIKSCLKPNGGQVLCGAKSYYFGCGGSTKQFKEFVLEKEGALNRVVQIEVLCDLMDGQSNVREILLFTFN